MNAARRRGIVASYCDNALIKVAARPVLASPPDSADKYVRQMQDALLRLLKQQDSHLGRKIAPDATDLREYLEANRRVRLARPSVRKARGTFDWNVARERKRSETRQASMMFRMRTAKALAKAPKKPKRNIRTPEERAEYLRTRGKIKWAKIRAERAAAREIALARLNDLFVFVCGEMEVLEAHVCRRHGKAPRVVVLAREVFAVMAMDTEYVGKIKYRDVAAVVGGRGLKSAWRWHRDGRSDRGVHRIVGVLCEALGVEAPAYVRKEVAA